MHDPVDFQRVDWTADESNKYALLGIILKKWDTHFYTKRYKIQYDEG